MAKCEVWGPYGQCKEDATVMILCASDAHRDKPEEWAAHNCDYHAKMTKERLKAVGEKWEERRL